ncbi:TIGR01620 family protein [Kangiella shandongensis]|uniref:TIGR01620 family protein n=1 Tax=Kangiella shandongensis TaxID=2763258 RepID=UPI001CBDF6AB|nr:TIGR01620 family protein [Kangiella shandongensis]
MSDKPVKFYSKDKEHQKAEKLLRESLAQAEQEHQLVQSEGAEDELEELPKLKGQSKKKSLLRRLFWPALSAFVVIAAGYEAIQFVSSLVQTHWLLGSVVGVIAGAVVVSGGYMLLKGWRARRRFKERQQQQKQFAALLHKNSYGQATGKLDNLSAEIDEFVDIRELKQQYQKRKQQVHNDQELIQIYSNTVLKGLDKMAIDIITKHAAEAAAMVALSPLAAADMALVAWRGSKMIEQLSHLYGCPQTALSRLEMTKKVFKNMMLAGASELAADAGVELLGKGLTATISTKAAQGIGVGLLVARMGLQTMHLCRPVVFDANSKPKLSEIRKSIYSKVAGLVKSASGADNAVDKKEQGKS